MTVLEVAASGQVPKRALSASLSGVEGTPDAGYATLIDSLGPRAAIEIVNVIGYG